MPSHNSKIIIACHKECDVPSSKLYLPLHVGAALSEPFGLQGDDTGDNISAKNPVYSELTGLYWAWKNLDCDYLGLVHYRRYLTIKNKRFCKINPIDSWCLSQGSVDKLLRDHSIILPSRREYYIENLYSHYAHTFDGKHLKITGRIISSIFPEYSESFRDVMNSTSGYMFNMFVMRKDLSDEYCKWLFEILFRLEKQIDVSSLSDFEKRFAGRVSERLFNVWLLHKIREAQISSKEIIEVPWHYTGDVNLLKKAASFLGAKFFNKKYEESF